jgi:hypothetical protein
MMKQTGTVEEIPAGHLRQGVALRVYVHFQLAHCECKDTKNYTILHEKAEIILQNHHY